VRPTTTTTYTLTASGPGGTASATLTVPVTPAPAPTARITTGLVAYYPFTEGSGTTVTDQAPLGPPLPLTLSGAVTWNSAANGVVFTGGWVGTPGPATKVLTALMAASQSTFELWVHPAQVNQPGPPHLLSLSTGLTPHNLLVIQPYSKLEVALRHTEKDPLGKPKLTTGLYVVSPTLLHLVHTYDGGVERLYVNGVEQPATVVRTGLYTNWNSTAALNLGNEATRDLGWRGTLRLVAIYNRALTAAEVQQNFTAGPTGGH
jgi:hypothetical protein